MNAKLIQLRELIKKLSIEQKELRPQRKENFEGIRRLEQRDAINRMLVNSYQLRHYHIAYSLLLGNSYEEIETKVRDHNEPSWSMIENIKKEYSNEKVIYSNAA